MALPQPNELFRDSVGQVYARIERDGHLETWSVDSKVFRAWLVPSLDLRTKPDSAIERYRAQAEWDSPVHEVAIRVGEADGCIYIDLADRHWRAVRIAPDGWSVTDQVPVRFVRPQSMKPLPTPQKGGSVDDLRPLLNVGREQDWLLIVGWLIGTMQPEGPYPLLLLTGEQGSAKSTTARILRQLIDPSGADLRSLPKTEQDLLIAARGGHVLAFDNLSRISDGMSDALARLATGGSFATRQLYTDTEEVIISASRPVIITSIADVVTRPDLIDRSIALELQPISPDHRRTESAVRQEVTDVIPFVLGALLDGASNALRTINSMPSTGWPRLADFARWVAAAEGAISTRSSGSFRDAYEANRSEARIGSIANSLVAGPVVRLAKQGWRGTTADLLEDIRKGADQRTLPLLPTSPEGLAADLKRLAPALRDLGVNEVRMYDKTRTKNRLRVLSFEDPGGRAVGAS